MNKLRLPVLILGLLLLCSAAWAQTDHSLRMFSLSPHLSGIIDDPPTDAYLNPARLAGFDRMQAYGAWLPYKTVVSPFPVSTTKDLQFGPVELSTLDYNYTPLAFGFIWPSDNGKVISAGMRASVSGTDNSFSHPSYDLNEWGTHQTLEQRSVGNAVGDDKTHLLFDLAAADKGKRSYGLRLTVLYNAFRQNNFSSTTRTTIDLDNMTDMSIYDNFSYVLRKYEETDVSFSMGRFESDGRWSDLSIGAAISKLRGSADVIYRMVEDTDADRNGDRIGGGSPYLNIDEDHYASHRDYLGLRLFGRAQWDVREKVRAVHTFGWSRSWGEGRAEFAAEESYYGANHDIDDRGGGYTYDGIYSDLTIGTAAGFSEEITANFVAIIGVAGIYGRIWFDEDGDGSAHLFLDQSNGSYDSLYASSPYKQSYDHDERFYRFVVPAGCEWEVHDYVKLRIGVEITAYHSDGSPKFRKSVAAIDLPPTFEEMNANIISANKYDTHARFNSGIEINVRDRFILDLLAFSSHSSAVNLDAYGYVSARCIF